MHSDLPPPAALMPRLRVALLDDADLTRAGLRHLATEHGDPFELRWSTSGGVDLVLVDTFGLPDLGAPRIRALVADPDVGAVGVFTAHVHQVGIDRALHAGARGVVSRSLPGAELVSAIARLARGEQVVAVSPPRPGTRPVGQGLTSRERELLALVAAGMRNREIAAALYLSEDTVKTHLKRLYRRLALANRAQAAAYAASCGGTASGSAGVPGAGHPAAAAIDITDAATGAVTGAGSAATASSETAPEADGAAPDGQRGEMSYGRTTVA